MRMPDASSYTWRKKLQSTQINRRTDHVINNSQDTPAPRLFSPAVRGYPGSGFGGKVQDASSFTLSRGANAIERDTFRAANGTRRIRTVTLTASGECLTRTPASQVVSELGNAEESVVGLNMGYTRQRRLSGGVIDNVGVCSAQFRPLTKSYFVDTIPDVKFHKSGTAPQPVETQTVGGRQNVQNSIICPTTNTSGVAKVETKDANLIGLQNPKAHTPFNSYSAPPNNAHGSGPNRVHRAFVTSPTGPQVGGRTRGGVRADKVGGVSVVQKRMITHHK